MSGVISPFTLEGPGGHGDSSRYCNIVTFETSQQAQVASRTALFLSQIRACRISRNQIVSHTDH